LSAGTKDKKHVEEQVKIKLIGTTRTSTLQLDLETLQKVSQTISSEIHLEKLLEKLLTILITSAGAEKGYILLKEDDKIFLEGEAFANTDKVIVLQHIPLGDTKDMAHLVINYVLRTNETVTLEDTGAEELFNSDQYIIRVHPKSLFCMPLTYQNKLCGILYLENSLITGAFTTERVELLKMLCGQIVISIENAGLYKNLEEYNRNLEEKVKIRTAEIALKNEQLNIQTEELHTTLENLRHSQAQLIQSEKMASLGQLVAGIAHEINNPVNFISAGVDSLYTNLGEIKQVLNMYNKITINNVDKTLKEIEKLKEKIRYKESVKEITKLIQSIKNGTYRTTEIIKGLRTFSHLDEDLIKTADLHDGLDSTLVLLRNRYKNRIEIVKKYADIPTIECYPDQLNQVFMNVLSNAIDAIENEGVITISTSVKNDQIQITICDTGKGIAENLKDKIFEPFFTTKEVGKGTGLGLSISHGIIEKHKGSITFKSEVGKGSEFIIHLPVSQA
jgi:histidine kinase